jgi:hypothetical protein
MIYVFDQSTDGHRESYFQVFEKLVKAKRLVGGGLFKTLKCEDCVYMSADHYFLGFFFVSLLRAFMGRKTWGLLIRAENLVTKKTLRIRVKKVLLRIQKIFPRHQNISIVPFSAVPGVEKYLHNWIYDLQFWDLNILNFNSAPSLEAEKIFQEIKERAVGRKIVMALGRQDVAKGLLFFFKLWERPEIQEEFFFVVLGKNRSVPEGPYNRFKAAGLVWDIEMLESDLIQAYDRADVIWCCYHPSYDVSSGLFGRSVQKSKISWVRAGSLISRYEDSHESILPLVYDDVILSEGRILSFNKIIEAKKKQQSAPASNYFAVEAERRFKGIFCLD